MSTIFKVEISIGNAAMDCSDDIANALRKVADRLEGYYTGPTPIFDRNGNNVGTYRFEKE